MKSEEEIKELYEKLNNHKLIRELDEQGFISYSNKAGHWLDCLSWILEEVK